MQDLKFHANSYDSNSQNDSNTFRNFYFRLLKNLVNQKIIFYFKGSSAAKSDQEVAALF